MFKPGSPPKIRVFVSNSWMVFQQLKLCLSISSLLLLGFLLAAYRAEHLQYELIAEGVSFRITDQKAAPDVPSLIVATSPEEVVPPLPGVELPEATKTRLQKIDFDHSFVLWVIRGQIPGSGVVYDVTRRGDKVILSAKAYNVGPGNYVLPFFTFPYQLIRISKTENWDADIHFVAERDGEGVIAETVHHIP